MTSDLVTAIDRIASACSFGSAPRALIIGDASAEMCTALARLGFVVDCCPDLQTVADARHVNERFRDLDSLHLHEQAWDLAVAVDGFRRVQRVHRPEELSRFLTLLADQASATIVEAPRTPLAPDLHDLGPYVVRDFLTGFRFVSELHDHVSLSDRPRPILVASNAGLLLDGAWIPGQELEALDRGRTHDESAVSTYRRGEHIIKIERASRDYFERCEASSEARFLTAVDTHTREALGLPHVLSWCQGRAVSTVVREWVPGRPVEPAACRPHGLPLAALVDFCSRMATTGLFHNDLRPWNLLWTGSSFTAVDYADAAFDDRDVQDLPQILAFAGTIAGLVSEELSWGSAFHEELLGLVSHEGISDRWPFEEQRGAPWRSLPAAATRLVETLSQIEDQDAGRIVSVVVEILMAAHNEAQRG